MAGLRRKPKFAADDLVIALQPFTGDLDDGTPIVVQSSMRLRGDHPAVRKWPQHFIGDGLPDDELARIRAEILSPPPEPPTDPQPPLTSVVERLPDREVVRAIDAAWIGDRHFRRGQRVRRDDPAVIAHPELFETPSVRLDVE